MSRTPWHLTKTEKDILEFLWDHGSPLTASEIVDLCPDRQWKASYIHLVLQSMLKKNAIQIEGFKPTSKNYARTFTPAMSRESFLVHEMVNELNLNEDHIRNLLVYLVESATDLDTISSMLDLCKEKRRQLT